MSARTRSQNRPSGAVHGVLLVDKPAKLTSHDVVAHVRRAFKTRRVGHAGTLDPMATGLLVVLLGEATKLSGILTAEEKIYEATVKFGESTDSLDADGKVTRRQALSDGWLDPLRLQEALRSEVARTLQIPPLVSAIKVDGQRSYAKARRGETHDLDPRDVRVHELTLIESSHDRARVRLGVSKGYYVRSFARDLGDRLSVPAHLTELRRLTSGPLRVENAAQFPLSGDEPLIDLAAAARLCLPNLSVGDEGAERLRQGKIISRDHLLADGSNVDPGLPLFAAFHGDVLVALVKPSGEGEFRVQRGMNDPKVGASPLPHMDLGD